MPGRLHHDVKLFPALSEAFFTSGWINCELAVTPDMNLILGSLWACESHCACDCMNHQGDQ